MLRVVQALRSRIRTSSFPCRLDSPRSLRSGMPSLLKRFVALLTSRGYSCGGSPRVGRRLQCRFFEMRVLRTRGSVSRLVIALEVRGIDGLLGRTCARHERFPRRARRSKDEREHRLSSSFSWMCNPRVSLVSDLARARQMLRPRHALQASCHVTPSPWHHEFEGKRPAAWRTRALAEPLAANHCERGSTRRSASYARFVRSSTFSVRPALFSDRTPSVLVPFFILGRQSSATIE
jgi:hypothetical protein